MVTFAVDKVPPSAERLETQAPAPAAHYLMFGEGPSARVEAAGARVAQLIPGHHGFVDAVRLAFSRHLPLVLSPDEVWLAIVQGHALASRDADPGGEKPVLSVHRDDFVAGGENPWPEVFTSFSEQLRDHTSEELRWLLTCDFSTTGPLERAASEVVMMGALKNRFTYEFQTLCGIPDVTLLGTVRDWEDIRARASMLCERADGLGWWKAPLDAVLRQLVRAASGKASRSFWRSIFKENSSSGGPYLTGWLNVLLPFSELDGALVPNDWARDWRKKRGWGGGISLTCLPSPLTCAPVLWRCLGQEIDLTFAAGFVGVEQDTQGRLRPAVGWAVLRGEG